MLRLHVCRLHKDIPEHRHCLWEEVQGEVRCSQIVTSWKTWWALISWLSWSASPFTYIFGLLRWYWSMRVFLIRWKPWMNKMAEQTVWGISHFNDDGLNRANTEKVLVLIRTAGNFVENRTKPAPFHALTFYSSTRTFLKELNAMFVDHGTVSNRKLVEFLNDLMSMRVQRALIFCKCYSTPALLEPGGQ